MASWWDFRTLMYDLEGMGVLDVILPFILVFTIVFAVLEKSKILGKDEKGKPRKKFNVVLSLALAFGVVIPHVTGMYGSQDLDVVNIINKALPNVSLIVIAIVMVLLLIGIFGKDLEIGESKIGGIFVIISIVIIGLIFLAASNFWNRYAVPRWLHFIYDPQFQALIVAVLVFGIIIWFITKSDDDGKDKKPSFAEELGKIIPKSK